MNRIPWLVAAFAAAFGGAAAAAPPPAQPPQPASPTAAEVASWAAPCKVPGAPHPFYIVLDGKAAPLAQRQTVLTKLEQCAQNGSVSAQDFIGALYWMGDTLPDALVRRDPARALMYFSNAAAHGDILDMAKLAEIELAQGHAKAAMVWAQLYGHYVPAQPGNPPAHHSYLAELVARVDASFNQKDMPDAMADADAFVARYGTDIRAYRAHWKNVGRHPPRGLHIRMRGRLPPPMPLGDSGFPYAGFADYVLGIDPAGKVDHAWLIDAFPTVSTGHQLRPVALSTRFTSSGKTEQRYAVLPIVYYDLRYTTVRGHG